MVKKIFHTEDLHILGFKSLINSPSHDEIGFFQNSPIDNAKYVNLTSIRLTNTEIYTETLNLLHGQEPARSNGLCQ